MPVNYFSSYDHMPIMAMVDTEGNNIVETYATKAELGEAGGFVVVRLTEEEPYVPDVDEPNVHKIYLTKIDDAPGDDKYKEWICHYDNAEVVWEVIGETTFEVDYSTITFQTQMDGILVDENTPMVTEEPVTLVNELCQTKLLAERAYQDEDGNNIKDSIAGKQDKLTASASDVRKCLGVRPDGSLGWINGGNMDDGHVLSDASVVQVPNLARSFLSTSQANLTLNVDLAEGEIPNLVVELTTTNNVSLRVTSTIGEFSTTLKYSASNGFMLDGGKTYQITVAGTCWTWADFSMPDDAEYDFGGITITRDQNGTHASVTDNSNRICISEPVQVTDFQSDRVYNVGAYSTCVLPIDIDASKITSGTFYEVVDIIADETAHDGYSAILSNAVTHIVANRPYLYVSNDGTLTIDIPSGTFITLLPTEEMEIPLNTSSGEWFMCGTYHYSNVSNLPGAYVTNNYYGFVGQAMGDYKVGEFAKMSGNGWFSPMRMLFRRPITQ